MNCPNCNETLVMSDKQGIEIDYCPKCRGIWLDRGELDKIIERSNALSGGPSLYQKPHHEKYHDDDYHKYHKKKNWLSDIFD